jgi:hypothetical protein
VVVVIAMVIAFVIGLHDGGDDNRAGGGRSSPSSSTSGSGSPDAPTAAGPTEDGMTTFIRDYIDTAVSDPASAYDMLTPAFQEQSHGLQGYEDFWDQVRTAKILSISADPDALEVSYRYRYVRPGGPTVEDVTLQLSYDNGTYLIAEEQ